MENNVINLIFVELDGYKSELDKIKESDSSRFLICKSKIAALESIIDKLKNQGLL